MTSAQGVNCVIIPRGGNIHRADRACHRLGDTIATFLLLGSFLFVEPELEVLFKLCGGVEDLRTRLAAKKVMGEGAILAIADSVSRNLITTLRHDNCLSAVKPAGCMVQGGGWWVVGGGSEGYGKLNMPGKRVC